MRGCSLRACTLALALVVLCLCYSAGADDTPKYERAIERVQRERQELIGYMTHNSTRQGNWTMPPLLRDSRLDAWLQSKAKIQKDTHAFFPNVSGFYAGSLSVHNVSHVTQAQMQDRGSLVWETESPLTTQASLVQVPVPHTKITRLWGELTVHARDTSGVRSITELDLVGVYVPKTGEVYAVGMPQTSPRMLDIRTVLGMLPVTSPYRKDTYTACLADLDERLQRLQRMLEQGDAAPTPATYGQAANNCSLQLYGQLQPAGPLSRQASLDLVEHELREPSGLVLPRAPALLVDWAGTSSACGLYVSSDAMEGLARAQFWNDARYYVLGMLVVLLVQLVLMSKECERAQTHSDIARLSGISLFIQTMYDSFISVSHLVLGFSMAGWLGHALLAIGFMAGTLSMVFEYRLAMMVLRQYTQDHRDAAPAAQTRESDDLTDDEQDEMHVPAWRAYMAFVRRRMRMAAQGISGRQALLVMGALSLSALLLWSPDLMNMLLVPVLFSYWLPQIIHNAQRRSTGLHSSTIMGMTMTRCYVPLYLFQYKHNLLLISRSPFVWIPIGLSIAQMLLLLGQNQLGPLFFLPYTWHCSEQQWNWHPSPEALAALLPSDAEAVPDPAAIPLGDCPICLMPNDWAAETSMPSKKRNWRSGTAPSGVMVTPVCMRR
ncbi:hypothetical protein MCAP1_002403 [Malassezia caprae]|uniref:RING-type E3 ubiquitin transferase n=1 Tax=Malassezia caprae TaxID=1381934 RepID=A0AAF0E8B0_9BASI|nr:hypothetical protein MCAP1_002403 [Malassezia caprae]